MTRLETINSYITESDKIIDIGCDQAILSKTLAKRGIYSIASDIKENIIINAINSTPKNLLKYIDYRVGNGITLKDNEEKYIPVLSGIGTYTILSIIKNSNKVFNKIITISNNNHDILRREMNLLNYKVLEEEIIKEKGKYYNLIIFTKGNYNYSSKELLIGINHKNIELLKEKNNIMINKYKKILSKVDNIDIKNKLDILIKEC